MSTRVGEMLDMISALAIYNGAEPGKKKLSFDDVMRLE